MFLCISFAFLLFFGTSDFKRMQTQEIEANFNDVK